MRFLQISRLDLPLYFTDPVESPTYLDRIDWPKPNKNPIRLCQYWRKTIAVDFLLFVRPQSTLFVRFHVDEKSVSCLFSPDDV